MRTYIHIHSKENRVDKYLYFFIRQPVEEKKNSEFKPALLHLKLTLCHILLVVDVLGKNTMKMRAHFDGYGSLEMESNNWQSCLRKAWINFFFFFQLYLNGW